MKFFQDRHNFNGNLPGGQSSALVTRDDNDNALNALPVGTGGITAQFSVPDPTVVGLEMLFNADVIAGNDGDTVTTWPDASGNNRTATTFAGAPILKRGSNGINGHNVVRFTMGTQESCEMRLDQLFVHNWPGISVYYIARLGASTGFNGWGGVFGWQASGQWLNVGAGNATDSQGAGWSGPTGAVPLGNLVPPFAQNDVRYGSYRYDKTLWTIDGANTSTHADTSWPFATVVPLIGSNVNLGSQSNNDYYEIRVYSRKLTDQEDAQVKAYMQWKAGILSSPARALQVGYPETITNYFSERYVHPSGSDSNDGKTWQTAKQTILAAWDSAVAEIGPSDGFTLHVEDGSYIGGEVASQGLWLTTGTVGPGWRLNRSYRIIGYGGQPPGRGFTYNKARVYQGRPGESQAFDLTKPLIWIEGSGVPSEVENIMPANYGFARLAVMRSGTRDGNLEAQKWHNVLMVSPPDTDPVYGPAYDCGWLSQFTFDNCQAAGSARYRDVALVGGDGANAAAQTITLANGVFDSTYVGGYLTIVGGLNEGQWHIQSVVGTTPSPTVVIHNTNGQAIVDETFTTQSVQKIQGPQIIDDDSHAGWLFRPTAIDMAGEPGSMGTVLFTGVTSTQQSGIKYYIGSSGEIGLAIERMVTEGGPQPHPVQITLQPGQVIPALTGSNTAIQIGDVEVADGNTFDNINVLADDAIKGRFGVGTVSVNLISGGTTNVACLWRGSDAIERGLSTTPTTARQYGWFNGGRLTGNHDAGRRIGAPGTALPSSSGVVGNHVTNLLDDNPGNWSASGATITKNTPDPFGLTNGAQIGAGSGFGHILLPQSASAPATTALDVGDFIVAGVWVRSPSGPDLGSIPLVLTSLDGADAALLLQPTWVGNAQWEFQCGYTTVTHAGTASFSLQPGESATAIQVAYPVLSVFKLSDGYTEEWVAELTAHLAAWNPNLAQGSVGTLRNQSFVASGGIGVGAATLVLPIGTASNTKNAPLLSDDGRTVQGYVPVLPSNSAIAAEPPVSWPTADEVMVSTGTGPVGYPAFTYTTASGLLKVGGTVEVDGVAASRLVATDASKQLVAATVDPSLSFSGGTLQRAALTGDVTAAAGSNATALAAVGTAGTYGSSLNVIRSITADAKGRVTAVTTSNKPQSLSFTWGMNANSLSMGYSKSSVILPLLGKDPAAIITAVAGTAVETSLAANWASGFAAPTIPLRDQYQGGSANIDVQIVAGSGTGAAMQLRFGLFSVVTDPAVSGNYTQIGTVDMTSIVPAGGPFTSFQTLGFNFTPPGTNASLVLAVWRDDVNNFGTITNLSFVAHANVWATP